MLREKQIEFDKAYKVAHGGLCHWLEPSDPVDIEVNRAIVLHQTRVEPGEFDMNPGNAEAWDLKGYDMRNQKIMLRNMGNDLRGQVLRMGGNGFNLLDKVPRNERVAAAKLSKLYQQ